MPFLLPVPLRTPLISAGTRVCPRSPKGSRAFWGVGASGPTFFQLRCSASWLIEITLYFPGPIRHHLPCHTCRLLQVLSPNAYFILPYTLAGFMYPRHQSAFPL